VLPFEVPEPWAEGCTVKWGTDPLFEKVEPTDPLEVLIDKDILDETESLLDPEISSGRNSEDEDDGARVPIEDPTG
jgi:hypothetical protein